MEERALPTPRSARCWMGIAAGVLLACSGGPWVSAAPAEFRSAGVERESIVARCVGRAQALGYSIDAVDYPGGFLRLTALSSAGAMLGTRPVPKSSSWLVVEVEDDGTVTVRAYGDLVSEEEARMHPQLRAEMDWLAGELEQAVSGEPPTTEGGPPG